jgi:hypothetical protein
LSPDAPPSKFDTCTIFYRIILHFIHADDTTHSCISSLADISYYSHVLKKGPLIPIWQHASMSRARLSTSFKLLCDLWHSTDICICICLSNFLSTHSWLSRHVNPTVSKECYHAHVIFLIHRSTDIHVPI